MAVTSCSTRSRFAACLFLVLAGCTQPSPDSVAPPPPESSAGLSGSDGVVRGESTFELIEREGYQGYRSLTETISHVKVRQGQAIVLKESVEEEVIYAADMSVARILIQAYDASDLSGPVWMISDSATTGGVWKPGFGYDEPTFYRTFNLGCCSASNTQTLYDLETGERILTSDTDILVVYRDEEPAYIGFRSLNAGAKPSSRLDYGAGVFGVLDYVSARGRTSIALQSPLVDSLEMMAEPQLTLVPRDASDSPYEPYHESDEVGLFYLPISGDDAAKNVAVRLDFWSDALLYLIPLALDGPETQDAVLPPHVTATRKPLGAPL